MTHPLTILAPAKDYNALITNMAGHWQFEDIILILSISSAMMPDGRVRFHLSEEDALSIVNDLPHSEAALPLINRIERMLIQRTEPVVLRWPSDHEFGSFVA